MDRRRWIRLAVQAALVVFCCFGCVVAAHELGGRLGIEKSGSVVKGEVVDASKIDNLTDGGGKIIREIPKPEKEEAETEAQTETEAEGQEEQEEPAAAPSENTGGAGVQEIQAQLENLVSTEYNAGGTAAVCTGRTGESGMAMAGGGAMQAASLIKLYVAGTVYENYGAVAAQEAYSGETESLISVMIRASDNSACNTLVARLGNGSAQSGMALVNDYCARHGFSDTHMGRLMLESNDADDNYTSVRDCCNYLKMADAGQLEGSSSVLGYMNQQERRGKIPAGIPGGVTVGNKTGELSDVENDAAIIYGSGGTYVLCVMTENVSDPYSARTFITRTSSVVYEAMQ